MSPMTKRSLLLALVASSVLVWGAVKLTGVAPYELLVHLSYLVFALLIVVSTAALFALLVQLFCNHQQMFVRLLRVFFRR